tara:strand:+ start:1264 stop:1866 length:603 start_codon:yes stop_codon:yes gene_type:complete
MQRFEVFVQVCEFFIKCKLDADYISKLDLILETNAPKEVGVLVKHVQAFHGMRKSLCQQIIRRLHSNKVFAILADAKGLTQYNTCPDGSTCALTGSSLKANNGIMLIVDGQTLLTVHSRYKIVLYHFWTLVHMPSEIGLESVKWLKQQKWWQSGGDTDVEQCTQKILHYNDQQFVKCIYVKLKAIAEYIENKLPNIPIKK